MNSVQMKDLVQLETSRVSQSPPSSLSEIVPQLNDYDLPANEPEHDFDQIFIESLCIDGDSDYDSESDVCPSACEDDLIISHSESNVMSTMMPPDCDIFDG